MHSSLAELISEICQYPLTSPKRRKAFNRLIAAIARLPGLAKSSHPDYLDAFNQTLTWVNREICHQFDWTQPDVERRSVQWLNSYLYWRIKDLHAKNSNHPVSLDAPVTEDKTITLADLLSDSSGDRPTRDGLDAYIQNIEREHRQNLALKLEQYIETDPENQLKQCHPKAYPQCNAQEIARRVLLKHPPEKFTAIAREFGINYQTLKSHWERNCRPLLQDIARQLGYQSES